MRDPLSKVLKNLAAAVRWQQACTREGRKVVVTNGCFDLLHRGHAEYLSQARLEGDALLVAVNSDASIRAVKGMDRPVIPQQDRLYMLGALEAVDAILVFDTFNCVEIYQALRPDVYVKGGDYTEETLNQDEYPYLKASGCRFCFIPFVPGYSTSGLIEKLSRLL